MAHESHCAGSSYDTVRDALQSAGCLIRPRGAQALMARCPLHTDHTPSLSVTWRPSTPGGRCGAVLLHCFSCRADAADLAAALGLRVADLFDAPLPAPTRETLHRTRPTRRRPDPARLASGPLPPRITADHDTTSHQWRRVRVYTYTDLNGRPIQQVIRRECGCTGRIHKGFQQRYRVGRQWLYRKPEGFVPGLYRPAAILAAKNTASWVWIAEGEKDADTLAGVGRLATTNPQGASNFPTHLVAQFEDLKVAVVADRDLTGYRRALALSQQLHGTAAQIVVLLAALEADKADLTDHVEAGLWKPAQPFGGLVEVTPADLHALTLAAAAAQAGHRFTVAIAEMLAYRARRDSAPTSAHAAARWLAEAGRHLGIVNNVHHELQRHARAHPTAAVGQAAAAATTLRLCIEESYRRHSNNGPAAASSAADTVSELNESA